MNLYQRPVMESMITSPGHKFQFGGAPMTNHPAEPSKTAYLQIVRSAMLGHAIADAMGVPVEFSDRSDRRRAPPFSGSPQATHSGVSLGRDGVGPF